MTEVHYIEVGTDHSGQRLDNYLKTNLKGVPLSRIYRIIRKGEVRINKGRAKPSSRLQAGDIVRIPPIRQSVSSATNPLLLQLANRLENNVIFKDERLLIINKPSGMAVHGGSGLPGGVIEALRFQAAVRTTQTAGSTPSNHLAPGSIAPGFLELAHRLDRQTSGCLVLARNRPALLDVQQQIGGASRTAKKHYLALLRGSWVGGQRSIRCKLRKNQQLSGERMVIVSESGKTAESIFSPLCCTEVASLVRIELLTGRTHQARVHALACGMPIAGDEKYGDREFNQFLQGYSLHRLFLHATSIQIRHPFTKQSLRFHAPLPVELQHTLTAMGFEEKIIREL